MLITWNIYCLHAANSFVSKSVIVEMLAIQDGSRAQLIAGREAVSYHKATLMSTSSTGDVFLTLPGQEVYIYTSSTSIAFCY